MAEFAMVTAMLMVLFLAVLGVGLWAYAHNLLASAAAQAARYAASVNLDATAASERAAEILADSFVKSAADTVACDTAAEEADTERGATMTVVHCRMDVPPILFLIGDLLPDLDVTAHVLREHP